MADYEARPRIARDSDKCECTHHYAAHSSNGMICGAACRVFVPVFDPKFPAATEVAS